MGDGIHDSITTKTYFNKGNLIEKIGKVNNLQEETDALTEFEDKINNVVEVHDIEKKFSDFCYDAKRDGFNLLRSLDCDSPCCFGEAVDKNCSGVEAESSSTVGKRNRQDSNNSSNSATSDVTRKATKKSRKKNSKKQELDDEIEKIMVDIETGRNDPSGKLTDPGSSLIDKKDSISIPPCEKISKKKKKKKQGIVSVDVASAPSTVIQNGGSAEIAFAKKNKRKAKRKGAFKTDKSPQEEEGADKLEFLLPDDKIQEVDDLKKDRKGPGKKQLALIQAALKKAKEEEERQKQDSLAKQKRAEEAERLRLEQLRLEEERKLKKKQKEKEKREKLKAQGKILTKAQKLARIRTEASISFWREQRGNIPRNGEKKFGPVVRTKNECRSINSEDDVLSSITDSGSSLESLKVKESSESITDPSDWDKGSQRSLKLKSLSESCNVETSNSSNKELDRRFQSDMSLHVPDTNVARNGPLLKSQSLHCIGDTFKAKDQKLLKGNQTKPYSSKFRSPVVCVLGHVDTGKTKILDNIRKSHVQASEAGGITQQIGATMVPRDTLKEKCKMVELFSNFDLQLPGLLIIDTPGHESFRNLRSRGSTLCDFAILVVDVMHGLEPQTIESINLLKDRKVPFIVALNKIDRIYGWEPSNEDDIRDVIKKQSTSTKMEFDKKFKQIILEFANESMNVALFYENPDPRTYVSVVPVSAISGDGMGNVLALVCQLSQNMMGKRLIFREELEAIVLEVKITAGLGTTLDVILVNGRLKEGDTIVLAGQDGPVVSQIRSLLTPQPLKELRVKNPYVEYKEIKGAQGVKVSGRDLDKVIAGLPFYIAKCPDQVISLKEKVTSLFRYAMNSIRLSERGVYVQASTLGSLEALLEFLKSSEIPYAGVKVGPVVKKDVIKASVMLEHDVQYAVILAFDVKIEKDAQEYAENLGIKIFQADIIYHLFDNFIDYREKLLERKKNEIKKLAVFPCKLRILPEYVFSIRDPIVLGVRVEAGVLRVGTPLCVPSKNALFLGCVSSIEINHQDVQSAKQGDETCIKIEPGGDEYPKTYGKQFNHEDTLVSRISRQTIDVCKEFHRKDLAKADWQLMVELKHLLGIT